MRLNIPQSSSHPSVRLQVNPLDIAMTLDDSHKFLDLDLPEGVDEDDVEVIAHFCGRNGKPDPTHFPFILKPKVEKPHDPAETEPDANDDHGGCADEIADGGEAGHGEIADEPDEAGEPAEPEADEAAGDDEGAEDDVADEDDTDDTDEDD